MWLIYTSLVSRFHLLLYWIFFEISCRSSFLTLPFAVVMIFLGTNEQVWPVRIGVIGRNTLESSCF